jgi:hypothetical protein
MPKGRKADVDGFSRDQNYFTTSSMMARFVDTIFCGTAFGGWNKRNFAKSPETDISRKKTHRYQPTILLFFANCKNFPGLAG